jgi:hypothetical protein
MKNEIKKLFFVQWWELDNEYSHQYETDDLLKVLRKIGNDTKQILDSVSVYESGVIRANFEYITYFISTDMGKLIDCEKI